MKYLIPAALLLLLILLAACEGTTDTEVVGTERIELILNEIVEAFNNHEDISVILAHYSDDYLHDGDGLIMAEVVWNQRWAEYIQMDIQALEVELDGSYATASFELHMSTATGVDIFLEPYEHGDFSYFHKEDGVWKIYGNQNPAEGNNLYISSEPEGARIYLDNAFMHQYTPATLHSVPGGDHVLRLYKEGWNELEQALSVSQTQHLDYTLSDPGWPRPAFDIDSPAGQMTVNAETVPVDAIVQMQAESGALSDFDGSYVIISVNGAETIVQTTGLLNTDVSLQPGENEVRLRATGAAGHTGVSDICLVTRI